MASTESTPANDRAKITAVAPTSGTLIGSSYNEPDYRDAYLIQTASDVTVEDFATGFFLSQPAWIARVSMNLGPREESRQEAIDQGNYATDSSVGSWIVCERAHDEIVFGEHMGFMEYRFSFFRRPDGAIEAGTSVKYRKRFAPFYFTVVKPFHIGFVRIALRNAARRSAEGVAPQRAER